MKYHNITKDDCHNGEGLRVVLWTSGCEHHCEECQNPITWDRTCGLEFDDAAKEEIFKYLGKKYATGLTLSGGDPLATFNRKDILELVKEVREKFPKKTIWSYTGYTFEQLLEDDLAKEILNYLDVIVDGKYVKELRNIDLPWRGSSNQRVIDVKKSLESGEIILLYDEDTSDDYVAPTMECCNL